MLYGCDDLFKPAKENLGDFDQFFTNPDFAQKLLVNAYGDIPGYYNDTDYATDDAVTNQKSNSYLKIATGAWTSSNNPVNVWTNLYGSIQNINLFLENIDQTTMAEDPEASDLFIIRMKGEAYGLRAVMMYYLLRNHGGYTEDGQLMVYQSSWNFKIVNIISTNPAPLLKLVCNKFMPTWTKLKNTYLWNIIISVLLMKFPRNTVLL